MKSRRKRITALLLAALIIMSAAAGCGQSTDSINTETGSNNAADGNNNVGGQSTNGAQNTGRPKSNVPSAPMDTAEIHFIDVGQGDSTLIIADNEARACS